MWAKAYKFGKAGCVQIKCITKIHQGAGADWMSTPAGEGVFQEESEGQKRLRTEWGTRKGRKPRLKEQEAM